MNSVIENWRVEQFAANVYHLSQQKGSRLASKVRNELFKGKAEFFDRLASAAAQVKSGRNQDTPNLDITHSRRMLTTVMYEWATLVDRKDKLQNIQSPESEYAKAAINALGRSMDSVIIDAALGTARTGEDGSSSQTLGNAQKVASVASAALARPNVQMLRKVKRLMDAAEAEGKRYIVHNASFLEALLSQTEITSADYNVVRALAQGELNSYMGFEFIRLELLGLASAYNADTFIYNTSTGLYDAGGTAISAAATAETAFCFCEGGLILGMTEGMVSRVSERDDKSYNPQVYVSRDFGAVRMEEAKVVQMYYAAG